MPLPHTLVFSFAFCVSPPCLYNNAFKLYSPSSRLGGGCPLLKKHCSAEAQTFQPPKHSHLLLLVIVALQERHPLLSLPGKNSTALAFTITASHAGSGHTSRFPVALHIAMKGTGALPEKKRWRPSFEGEKLCKKTPEGLWPLSHY